MSKKITTGLWWIFLTAATASGMCIAYGLFFFYVASQFYHFQARITWTTAAVIWIIYVYWAFLARRNCHKKASILSQGGC